MLATQSLSPHKIPSSATGGTITNTWFSGGGSGAGHSGTNVYSQAQTQGSGYTTVDTNSSTLVLPTTYGSGGAAMHGATSANNSKMYGMQGIVIIRYAV